MYFKPEVRSSIINKLEKEALPFSLDSLSDERLMNLNKTYRKWQREGCSYWARINEDFHEQLRDGKLVFVSFTGLKGIRRLTFREYLDLKIYKKHNPETYIHLDTKFTL